MLVFGVPHWRFLSLSQNVLAQRSRSSLVAHLIGVTPMQLMSSFVEWAIRLLLHKPSRVFNHPASQSWQASAINLAFEFP